MVPLLADVVFWGAAGRCRNGSGQGEVRKGGLGGVSASGGVVI